MNKKDFITDLIKSRQSIYPLQYTGKKISQEDIQWLLSNAIDAPSHAKTNPWRFHVLGPDMMPTLTKFFEETYKAEVPEEKFNERKYNAFSKNLSRTSHLLILSMVRDEKERIPEWEEIAAVSMAVQNIYLSVAAAELGGYWSSPRLFINNIEKLINFKENEKCLGFFYLGVPQNELPEKPSKGLIDDYVKWY